MATSTYGTGANSTSGANTVVHYYDRAGIKAANAMSIYGQFIDRKSMPLKMGKTFKISKWQHIYDLDQADSEFAVKGYLGKRDLSTITAKLNATDGSGASLLEGAGAINTVTPTKVTVEASLSRYGFMIEYTDEAMLYSEDMIQVKYREELGYLMNQTNEDLLQKDMLSSAGIVINAGGDITENQIGTGITGNDVNAEVYKVSFDLIRKGVKALVRNRAQRNTDTVWGSTKIGTKPVNKAFYGIIGPEIKYDLETLTRGATYEREFVYIPAYQYASAGNLAEGEVGSMHDVRFIESEAAMIGAGAGALVRPWVGDGDGLQYATEALANAVAGNTSSVQNAVYTGELSYTGDQPAGDTTAAFDTFPVLFPTKGSFASVGLKGQGKVKFYSKGPEDVDLTNPHGTKGFFSGNFFYAGLALQPEKLLRINMLATA